MMLSQTNNLQGANISGAGIDNSGATIGTQINNFAEKKKQETRKVRIFTLNKTIELNDDAIIMDSYTPSSPISEGTVNHQGCKIDIDKISIGKLETEKLKMDLRKIQENMIKRNEFSTILGYIE